MKYQSNFLLICSALLLLLSACSSARYETIYTYSTPTSTQGRQCVVHCEHARDLCRRQCGAGDSQCVQEAKHQAKALFEQYAAEQSARGMMLEKTWKDFYKPNCSSVGCQCEEEFRHCVELCGLHAIPQRHCVRGCDKQSKRQVGVSLTLW